MDFRTELAKWGYNRGNSIDVEILIDEILPNLFSQQERSYSEEDMMDYSNYRLLIKKALSPKEWFEQFKKK
jgi:hypothetical protein